jgi:hypothetical protein
MSHTSISIICPDPKETAINIASISRLIARLDPDDLAEEADIVGELLAAIAEAAGTVASSFKYPGSESDQPAPSAFDLTDARSATAGWDLLKPGNAMQ